MKRVMPRIFLATGVLAAGIAALVHVGRRHPEPPESTTLRVLVVDMLAVELGCSCAPGAPQRHYDRLRAAMQSSLRRPVPFDYMADFLFEEIDAAEAERIRSADVLIGKHSAIAHVAAQLDLPVQWIASLTRGDGASTLTGLFVARAEGPVKTVRDLEGRTLSLGMPFHAEKHAAPLAVLRRENLHVATTTLRLFCKDAVAAVAAGESDAAVISDYSEGLLRAQDVTRGKPLAVIGKTDPVPYIAVFANKRLTGPSIAALRRFLIEAVRTDPELLDSLASKSGFTAANGDDRTSGTDTR